MQDVLSFLDAYNGYFLIGFALLILLLLLHTVALSRRIKALNRRRNRRLEEGNLEDIVDCVTEQSNAVSTLQNRIDGVSSQLDAQSAELARCLHKIGIVRFNAFDDVGGEQSFALAMLDSKRDGIVISSLYGRQESRLYAKAIVRGEGERALSDEERKALEKALA